MNDVPFEIFLATYPGLEDILAQEVRALGYGNAECVAGGVTVQGNWPDVWRLNLTVRGATRILARFAEFRALHPAQLDKRVRKLDWARLLGPQHPIKVEATCRKSRIYHAGAAKDRVERAISDILGLTIDKEADVTVRVRIEDDLCTLSVDTSGALLHLRGHKQAVGKAPLRETLAALLLRKCGFDGSEPVVDPMCGSGTFVLEAAEINAGLLPGRSRHFAFEKLATFDADAYAALQFAPNEAPRAHFFGYDRDQGAIQMCQKNAERAGLESSTAFACQPVSELERPVHEPGLVIVNPPYGARIGKKHMLHGLYASLGARLRSEFAGWRLGMVTTDRNLAYSTGLKFKDESAPIPHGGLKVRLFQTGPL